MRLFEPTDEVLRTGKIPEVHTCDLLLYCVEQNRRGGILEFQVRTPAVCTPLCLVASASGSLDLQRTMIACKLTSTSYSHAAMKTKRTHKHYFAQITPSKM